MTSATHTLITAFVSGKLSYDALSKQLRTGAQQSANALDETRQAIRDFVEAGHLPNELGQRLQNQLPAGDAKPSGYDVKDNPPRPHAVHGTQQEPVSAPAPEQAATPPANLPPLPLLNEPAGATGGETASDETRGKMDEAILTSLVAGYAGFRSRRANAGEEPPPPADSGKLDKYLTEFKSARFRSDARRVSGGGQRDSLDVNKLAAPQVKRAGVGSILRDRFILDTEIGSGGMGHVYSAVDRRRLEAAHDQPYVAIKLLNENYRNDTEAVRLLEAEARKSQALAHPNITTVYDFDRDKADVFIVMEQLNGVGLDRRIGRALGKPLPLGECARVLRGTCAGLSHAHSRGVVHSDLKPGNIFLLTDG
ncbi:MAG: serine/threonine-protein kinase, partial [Pseudomonadota bacterium]|nr:serine/threonine-protein kinase [Pseudomonadota bacterium]